MVRLNGLTCALFVAALIFFAAADSARAGMSLTLTRRELIRRSDHVVVAEPVDHGKLVGKEVKFIVRDVLRSERLKAGDALVVRSMAGYDFRRLDETNAYRPPPYCKQELLFLCDPQPARARRPDPGEYILTDSGVRYLTEAGQVLLPAQEFNPGEYYFREQKDEDWRALVERTRLDCEAVAEVLRLKDIEEPAQRNRAIFAWIEKHRHEFTGLQFDGLSIRDAGWGFEEIGWGWLERDVFVWILDSCRPDDALRAIRMWRSIEHPIGSKCPVGNVPTFASEEGRKLLLRIAADPNEANEDRQGALCRLAGSLWPVRFLDRQLGLSCVTPQERALLTREVQRLAMDDDEQMRRCAMRALESLASLPIPSRP